MRILSLTAFVLMLASFTMADVLNIKMKDGQVHKFDTQEILSMTYGESEQPSIDLSGKYNYSGQTASAVQRGDTVKIMYNRSENALITGEVEADVLTGVWIEDASGRKCEEPKQGRFYWGKTVFKIQANGNLKGQWGYCEDEPSQNWEFIKIQ
ncbi:MAG: hypothetical protein C0602_04075 [Denitrovibrio sp.]|nr:MAG: hypothetical protein C0602_04075 [Denitrovibrio sp.]